jgi:hypothetical protein
VVVALPYLFKRHLPPRAAAARHTHHTSRRAQCKELQQHGRTVASCLSRVKVIRPAMLPTRAKRRRATVKEGGWAELPDELLQKMLELLQAAGQGGLGFSQVSATVRLVCAAWKAVHDALVRRLVLRRQTTDEAVGMLVRRFPAVSSLEFKGRARLGCVHGRGAACPRSPLSTSQAAPR